jgi:hypothetical protein
MLLVPVLLLQLAVFLPVARYRLIDGDEGFYLMASRLVFEHRVPYRDFFFTQMPLLPYIYGLWMRAIGTSWVSARMLSGLLTALLGTLLYAQVRMETRKWSAGLFAVALFASSTLILAWFTIAKTFALSGLFVFCSCICLTRLPGAFPRATFLASGFLLGLAADVRLFLAGLIPIFFVWAYRDSRIRARGTELFCFLAGFAIAVVPNLYFLVLDPQAFLFGNLGWHEIRSNAGFVGNFGQKLLTLVELFSSGGSGLEFTLLITSLILTTRMGVSRPATRLALQLMLGLGLLSLLPTPTYIQYFCLCVPFLITAAVSSISDFLDSDKRDEKWRLVTVGCAGLVVLFFGSSIWDCRRYVITGERVNGIHGTERAINFRIDTVCDVSRGIDALAYDGERVMSLWPGYIFQSKTVPFPGLENNTGRERADALSPTQLSRYHILSRDEVDAQLRARLTRLFVLGNQESMHVDAAPYEKMLVQYGYTRVRAIGDTSIWTTQR